MKTLIPIKIKVLKGDYTKGESKMAHPPFEYNGVDIYNLIDLEGIGMHYDKTAGIGLGDSEQFVFTALPKVISDAFIAAHPTRVEELTDADATLFWETKAHANEPAEKYDSNILQSIAAKQQLSIALTSDDTKALDPNDDVPGIVKNPKKTWVDYKAQRKISIE